MIVGICDDESRIRDILENKVRSVNATGKNC